MPNPPPPQPQPPPDTGDGDSYQYFIRPSPVLMGMQAAGIQFAVGALVVAIHISLLLLRSTTTLLPLLDVLIFILIIVLQLGGIMVVVYLLVAWLNTKYIITKLEIITRTGIWRIQEKIFTTEHVEQVAIDQSRIGKWFDYGTLRVSSPVWKQPILLRNITDPETYAEVIRQSMSIDQVQKMLPTKKI